MIREIVRVGLVIPFLGICIFLGGCSTKSDANMTVPRYTEPGTIVTRVDEQFMIALPANRTTGYSWQLAEPLNDTVVRLMSDSYWVPMAPRPGEGGEQRLTFRGMGAGQATIKLVYVRPWEPTRVEKRADFTVSVK